MHIVIDGYNLIRQSTFFSHLDNQDLQAGRDALVDALVAYKRIKAFTITVVFDGKHAPAGMPRREKSKGIELRYSRSGELADDVIKRMAGRYREKLTVVSSDNDIIAYAGRKGAAVISAAEFEDRLAMAQMMDIKGVNESQTAEGWRPTTKKTGPKRRLPRRQRKMRKRIAKL